VRRRQPQGESSKSGACPHIGTDLQPSQHCCLKTPIGPQGVLQGSVSACGVCLEYGPYRAVRLSVGNSGSRFMSSWTCRLGSCVWPLNLLGWLFRSEVNSNVKKVRVSRTSLTVKRVKWTQLKTSVCSSGISKVLLQECTCCVLGFTVEVLAGAYERFQTKRG
jgi:hypothetical protein